MFGAVLDMTLKERLKGVAIAIAILLVCMPLAIALTIFTASFWSWFEATFAIESIGHSGPAEWCYLVSYGLLVVIATAIWSSVSHAAKH
jgi:hypothetical protein